MARFETEDNDFPTSENHYYDPEDYFDINRIQKKKKTHSSFFDNLRSLSGNQMIYIIFTIIWILILLNLNHILDWMFYTTLYILQYVIIILLIVVVGYFIWKKIF